MDKQAVEKRTKRMPKQTGALSSANENGQSMTAKKKINALLVKGFDKLGFEADFESKDKENTPATPLPQRAWEGVKSMASNTRTVMLNKAMAYDKPLFVLVIVLTIVGFIMMSSASYAYSYSKYGNSMYLINRQFIFILIGIPAMLLISTISPDKLRGKTSYILWAISIALLVVVLFKQEKNGVHRWIGVGPLTFQPSEIAKFTAILVCATYISYHYKEINLMTYGSLKRKQLSHGCLAVHVENIADSCTAGSGTSSFLHNNCYVYRRHTDAFEWYTKGILLYLADYSCHRHISYCFSWSCTVWQSKS